jgi:hypothetical protein
MPRADDLRVVWFEETNGIALFEGDKLLALIPPWSGQEGFHGYALGCTVENQVCWPMPDRPALHQRIAESKHFWAHVADTSFRSTQLAQWTTAIQRRFGEATRIYTFPWCGAFQVSLHEYRDSQGTYWISHGLSLFPQPNVELSVPRFRTLRRIELGIRAIPDTEFTTLENAMRVLAPAASMPWRHWTWLADQHQYTLPWRTAAGELVSVHWRLHADAEFAQSESSVRVREDPVNLLWLTPDVTSQPASAGRLGEPID